MSALAPAALDTVVTAEAPEGIELALRPAGMVARSHAFLIDFGVRIVIVALASMLLGQLSGFGFGTFLILVFLVEWWYPVLFELLPGAATPGKRALGLTVVMDDGLPVTPAASLIRNLLRSADFLPVLYAFGLVFVLLRRDFKRIGDIAAGTLVVHARAPHLHGALPDAAPRAPARALSPREQAAVIAWAGRAERLTPARHAELAGLAAALVVPGRRGAEAREPLHPDDEQAQQRLLGVAHWLLGRR